jgi:hypothetical protein
MEPGLPWQEVCKFFKYELMQFERLNFLLLLPDIREGCDMSL